MGIKIHRKTLLKTIAMTLLICILMCGCGGGGETTSNNEGKSELEVTAEAQMKLIERPGCAAIGGEWTVMALARSDQEVEKSYWEIYLTNLKKTLKETGGVLSENKYTEYSRVILALTALGEDPTDFDGHNLLAPLADFDGTTKQGINGAVYALIALDSGDYELPETDAENLATREKYIEWILSREHKDGGFALSVDSETAEADVTAMVLQCLVPYKDDEKVAQAIDRGVEALAALQSEEGYFESWDKTSSETLSQAIIALSALGIDCNTDERFVKNEKGMMDVLLTFYNGEGAFSHTADGEGDVMATEQALCAMVAYERYKNQENSFYDMSDHR